MKYPWTAIRDSLGAVLSRIDRTDTALQALTARVADLGDTSPATALEDALDVERATTARHRTTTEAALERLAEGIEQGRADNKNMLFAISEGIERVDRAERRVKASIQRAQAKLRAHGLEDEGLEAEASEFLPANGDGGEPGRVPTMPPDVESAETEDSSVKGVSLETMKRFRGL